MVSPYEGFRDPRIQQSQRTRMKLNYLLGLREIIAQGA